MRIISGIYRGRHIHPPRNFKARPTTDFAKESLFNILIHQFDLEDLEVLDLFSGTGSITYEFASRGVRSLTAIEKDPAHFRFIQKTIRELDFDGVTPVCEDALRFLKKPYQSFDIIFADPPFDHIRLDQIPDMIFSTEILSKDGWFILEHPAKHSFTAHPHFLQHRRYGGVNFSIFG